MQVTLDQIYRKIKSDTYLVLPDGRTTVCQLTLENGYTINGVSACVDIKNFNLELGRKYAYENAVQSIWHLEGYLLMEKMYAATQAKELVNTEFDKEYAKHKAAQKKPHWTQTAKGRKIMANRKPRGAKK